MASRETKRNRTPHGVADEYHALDLEGPGQFGDAVGEAIQGDPGRRRLASTESRQVGREHPAVVGERGDRLQPVLPTAAHPVDEHDGPLTRPRVHVVQPAPRDPGVALVR